MTNSLIRSTTELAKLCSIPPRNGVYKPKPFVGRGVKLVRMGELFASDVIDGKQAGFQLLDLTVSEKSRFLLENGDLLFSRTSVKAAGIGKCSIVRLAKHDELVFDSNMIRVRLSEMVCCPKYFFYYFLSPSGRDNVRSIASGVAVTAIKGSDLSRLEVPALSLAIQLKIASILSAYDDLIENNLRRIRILEEMAQNLYREWFVKFRFPGHENARFIDSTLGRIPEGWKVLELGDVAEINSTSIRKGTTPENILYVDIKSVSTGSIDIFAPMAFSDAPSRARRTVQHGDTIWSSVRPNRRSYSLVLNPLENMIVSTGFGVIRPTAIPYTYCYYATTTDTFADYLTNRAKGAAYPAVNVDDFKDAKILMANDRVLAKFHMIIEPMVLLRESLRQCNAVLRRTRDLLLPRLISGELDVSELDITVEENIP